jgi:hypothetical protein
MGHLPLRLLTLPVLAALSQLGPPATAAEGQGRREDKKSIVELAGAAACIVDARVVRLDESTAAVRVLGMLKGVRPAGAAADWTITISLRKGSFLSPEPSLAKDGRYLCFLDPTGGNDAYALLRDSRSAIALKDTGEEPRRDREALAELVFALARRRLDVSSAAVLWNDGSGLGREAAVLLVRERESSRYGVKIEATDLNDIVRMMAENTDRLPWTTRRDLLWCLGTVDSVRAKQTLVAHLSDSEKWCRYAAVQCLRRFNNNDTLGFDPDKPDADSVAKWRQWVADQKDPPVTGSVKAPVAPDEGQERAARDVRIAVRGLLYPEHLGEADCEATRQRLAAGATAKQYCSVLEEGYLGARYDSRVASCSAIDVAIAQMAGAHAKDVLDVALKAKALLDASLLSYDMAKDKEAFYAAVGGEVESRRVIERLVARRKNLLEVLSTWPR